jgi:hypothetical protein
MTVNVSRLQLSNITGERTLNLGDASYGIAEVTAVDGIYINITIVEPMRIDAIPLSGTPGGDNGQIVLDIDEGAFLDLSGNAINTQSNLILSEFPDISPPTVTTATLHLGTGILELFADETMDLSPLSEVNLTRLHIADNTGDGYFVFPNEVLRISGRTGRNGKIDGITFNVSITERERVKLIAASNTPGGDQTTLVLDAFTGFVHDIGLKDNLDNLDIAITEIADIIPPTIETATLNLTDGVMVVSTSEIIDTTPFSRVNLSKIILSNLTESDPTGDIALTESTVTADDNFQLVLKLSELERVRAIQISNTDGGDNGTAFISIIQGAVYDIGRNDNVEKLYFSLIEIEDSLKPTIVSVSLNYSTGIIVISATETIDSTPRTLIDTTKILLYNANVGDALTILNGNVVADDKLQVTMTLTEDQRALGIKRSGTPGGDNGALLVKLNSNAMQDIGQNGIIETDLTLIEYDDVIHPIPLVAVVNFTFGTVTLNFSETILAEQTSQYNFSNVYFSDIFGQKNVSLSDSTAKTSFLTTVKFTMSERTRVTGIEHSATPGGDGLKVVMDIYANAFQDVATNFNRDTFGIEVVEFPDILTPHIISGKIFLGNGHITLLASEILDLTPLSKLKLSQMFLANVTGDERIPLATVFETISDDHAYINITLLETQRVQAVLIANQRGGDNEPIVLDIGSNTFVDIAQNGNHKPMMIFWKNSQMMYRR